MLFDWPVFGASLSGNGLAIVELLSLFFLVVGMVGFMVTFMPKIVLGFVGVEKSY